MSRRFRPAAWHESGLVLAGHGSTRAPGGTAAIRAHADAIRARDLFASVEVGYLNGEPALADAVAAAAGERVFVVPCFMSAGAAATHMIPRAVAGDGRVRVCDPSGTHPAVAGLAAGAAAALCRDCGLMPGEAVLLLVGHGSPGDPASREATRACAAAVRCQGGFVAVETAFLDEAPYVADVLGTLDAPTLVVVGFFADWGRHAAEDVPQALGLTSGERVRLDGDGRRVLYAGPVGAVPGFADLILERVAETDSGGRAVRP